MAWYNTKKYNRALEEQMTLTPEQRAEIDEGLARLELVERAQAQFRDPDGRFVNRAEAAERLGVELSDELPPRDFADGDYLDIEELGATGDDIEDEDDEENEDAAWCRLNRRLCVPYSGMTGVPRQPPKGYRPAPTAQTFAVRKTGKWSVELRAV